MIDTKSIDMTLSGLILIINNHRDWKQWYYVQFGGTLLEYFHVSRLLIVQLWRVAVRFCFRIRASKVFLNEFVLTESDWKISDKTNWKMQILCPDNQPAPDSDDGGDGVQSQSCRLLLSVSFIWWRAAEFQEVNVPLSLIINQLLVR